MFGLEKFLGGAVLSLLTLIGLFISARAHDGPFAWFGYLLFLFGVLMLFRFVALVTGKGEAQP
jgi:hypothetical protein